MNNDLETIKNRLNIVDVIGQYLKLEKAGANWRAVCPFHNEKTPSFMVSEDKQIFHCFGCQKGGDIFTFVMEMEGLDFREALKILAEKAGIELTKFEANPEKKKEKDRSLEILELATKFYEHCLWKNAGGEKVLKYLKERGLEDETIRKFRLGYAPNGWRNLLNFLTQRGYGEREIEKSGLLVKKEGQNYYDRFRGRIVFPIAESQGKIVGFSARVTPGQDESQAKYINTPETDVYHKSRILFGLDKAKTAIKQRDSVLLVEGNMDVVAAHQADIENVVAVSGTALTPEQIKIIKRYTENIKMFFDMDEAGKNATKKSLKLCFKEGLSPQIVSLPFGKDAADLVKEDPKLLAENIGKSQEAVEYLLNKSLADHDAKNAGGKKKIAEEMVEMLAYLESDLEKNHWLKILAEKLDSEEKILTEMLKKVSLESSNWRESPQEEKVSVDPGDRVHQIQQRILGLILAYPIVWEKITEESNDGRLDFLDKSELGRLIQKDGQSCTFDFRKFFDSLSDSQIRAEAERLFVEEKYNLNLDGELEEKNLVDPIKELEKYLQDLRIDACKKKLTKIAKDLKIAQDNGDKEGEKFLQKESSEIANELATLI